MRESKLNETRVNLKHLLEDIRDSYTSPLEEVIVTEMIANALDSKADRICFTADSEKCFLECLDNGKGMRRFQLKEYHNIASSNKQRGMGIGFAGVGAKLSLLLADKVVTESKGGYGSRAGTEWRLTNTYRAPWKFVPTSERVIGTHGTSVTIYFSDGKTRLTDPNFIKNTVIKHFYPLLHHKLREEILRYVYKKPIEFVINGELLIIPEREQRVDKSFKIYLGKSKRPIGSGFLTKKVFDRNWLELLSGQSPEETWLPPGLSVSTFGKVIKTGWEWLGILPKNNSSLCGIVEVPALSELLTTNKNDFLSDAVHLRQYYKIRKAIQEAVLPLLKSIGEYGETPSIGTDKSIKPLTRQIETAIENMTNDFPELISLLGTHRKAGSGFKKPGKELAIKALSSEQEYKESAKIDSTKVSPNGKNNDKEPAKKSARPGLIIILEELKDSPLSLGRIIEETISINTLHPAWEKALKHDQHEYHILLTVGLVLSEFLAPDKHPQRFIENLFASWGKLGQSKQTLF